MGISSRHKKRARSQSTLTKLVSAAGTAHEVELAFDSSPHVMHLPVYNLPLRLGGEASCGPPRGLELCAIDTLHFGDAATVVHEHSAISVQFEDQLDVWAFARMLAKIAHCYYIAERGWFPLNQSPVLAVIEGTTDSAREWIGCLEDAPLVRPESQALHLMDITDLIGADGSVCSVVRIKLFSPTSGPTYAVVARLRVPNE